MPEHDGSDQTAPAGPFAEVIDDRLDAQVDAFPRAQRGADLDHEDATPDAPPGRRRLQAR
jgi:hypothetical protein